MKKLFFILSSVFLLSACDPTFRVQEGSQSDGTGGGSGNVVAGKDVTSLIATYIGRKSTLRSDCQPHASIPNLWISPRIGLHSRLEYILNFYTDNLCSDYIGDLYLEFDLKRIVTTPTEDEYVMALELLYAEYYDPDSHAAFADLHDFNDDVGESFYWQIKLDPAVLNADITMPSPEELEEASSESEPLRVQGVFYTQADAT